MKPVLLENIELHDEFWSKEFELVRTQVLPYQWEVLNDRIEEVERSYCMHNFKAAAKVKNNPKEPSEKLPEFWHVPDDTENPKDDEFYGFVFQDTDFSKWVEAVAYSLAQHPDENLESTADAAIDIVCEAQQDDGYLDTFYILNGRDKEFTNLRDNHELYVFGHLTEAAVAYYQATGKDKLLCAVQRFADYIDEHFGTEEGKRQGYPGHEIAEMALIRLYEVTGDKKYYNLSKYFIDERGKQPYYFDYEEHPKKPDFFPEKKEPYEYFQAHRPVREQDEAVGHAVRAMYLYSGMADVARLSGDETLLAACRRLWNNAVYKKMYITGGLGGTHIGEAFSFDFDLPNDTAYAESCASVGMVFFAWRMLQMEVKREYADVLELQVYNSVLSGMALDGKSFFYVNPLEVFPKASHKDERKYHVRPVRQKWFACACCPPNIVRLVTSIGSYAYTEDENTLYVHMYIGSTVHKTVENKDVAVEITSQMPWEGKATVRVKAQDTPFTLALRVPGWCDGNYKLGGFDGTVSYKDGYLYLQKEWMDEEVITLDFSMEAKFIQADTRVRENVGKVALMRGPVVYCMEGADNGENLHLCKLDINSTPVVKLLDIQGNAARKIVVSGEREKENRGEGLYFSAKKPVSEAAEFVFIPYYMWANRGENEMQVWTRLM